MGMTKYRKGP